MRYKAYCYRFDERPVTSGGFEWLAARRTQPPYGLYYAASCTQPPDSLSDVDAASEPPPHLPIRITEIFHILANDIIYARAESVSSQATMSSIGGQLTYKGYAAASRFMNSSDGVTIFRRFGELHVRNLLHIQYQLGELEARIHERDLDPSNDGCSGSLRHDRDRVRKSLMKQLRKLLKEYGKSVKNSCIGPVSAYTLQSR
jgi:hypothetical protein